MTAMEDRVHAALRDETEPVPVEAFLADVHRGARRRHVRRSAATVAAVAVTAAVVVGVTGWWAAPTQDRRPQPAGIVPWDSPQAMTPVPTPNGSLYGLAGTPFCDTGCPAVLWMEDDDGRAKKVHEFTAGESVSWVDFAPDTRHGFAFGQLEDPGTSAYLMQVWRTDDGGTTWEEVQKQLAGYRYPPDVEYLDGDAYVLTRPMTATPPEEGPHLWRTPIDTDKFGEAWEEISLTDDGVDFWFDMLAGLVASAGSDGETEHLAVVARNWIMVSDDGNEWRREVSLPCTRQGGLRPTFTAETASTMFVWCPAVGEKQVQLWRSVDLQPFEPLGPVLRRGHMFPTTYPTLVGPFPVETEADDGYGVVRVDEEFVRLEPDGKTTRVDGAPLLGIADVLAPNLTHGGGRTYYLTADGRVVTTNDGGVTWSRLGD